MKNKEIFSDLNMAFKLDEARWFQALKEHIVNLLVDAEIGVGKTTLEKLFASEKQKQIWKRAYTSELVSDTENYETLEYLGDKMLDSVFSQYMDWYVEVNNIFLANPAHTFTAIRNRYLGKAVKFQDVNFFTVLNLNGPEYLRRPANINYETLKMKIDIFEAFFGALFSTADEMKQGIGFYFCYNLFEKIIEDVTGGKIEMSVELDDPKTKVTQALAGFRTFYPGIEIVESKTIAEDEQAFERVSGNVNVKSYKDNDGTWHFDILATQALKDFMKDNLKKTIRGDLLSKATGKTKKEARMTSYAQAWATLESLGLTPKKIREIKYDLKYEQYQDNDLVDDVIERLRELTASEKKERQIQDFSFADPPAYNLEEKKYAKVLFGVRNNESRKALLVRVSSRESDKQMDSIEIEKNMLRSFLKKRYDSRLMVQEY